MFPLTVEINLSAVHLCMRSPILTSTVLGIGTAGVYSPSTGSTWCDKLWKHRSWKSFFCHFFSGRYLLGMWCCTLRNPTPFYILNYGPHLSQFGQMQFLNLHTSHYLIVNLPIFKSLTEFPLLTHTSNPPISSWKSSVHSALVQAWCYTCQGGVDSVIAVRQLHYPRYLWHHVLATTSVDPLKERMKQE